MKEGFAEHTNAGKKSETYQVVCEARGQLQVAGVACVKDNVTGPRRPKMGVAEIEEAGTGK